MNPFLKPILDKVLNDPVMLGNLVKSGIDSLLKAREEARELRESVVRTQAEVLRLRDEFDEYRRTHP